MAPDVVFYVPGEIEGWLTFGQSCFLAARTDGVWKEDGPPMPEVMIQAYEHWYVWTHSAVVVAGIGLLFLLAGRKRWLFYLAPVAFHIFLDVFTHERFLTPVFHPIWDWTFRGISWSDPRVFWPHLAVLLATLLFFVRWLRRRPPTSQTFGEAGGNERRGVAPPA